MVSAGLACRCSTGRAARAVLLARWRRLGDGPSLLVLVDHGKYKSVYEALLAGLEARPATQTRSSRSLSFRARSPTSRRPLPLHHTALRPLQQPAQREQRPGDNLTAARSRPSPSSPRRSPHLLAFARRSTFDLCRASPTRSFRQGRQVPHSSTHAPCRRARSPPQRRRGPPAATTRTTAPPRASTSTWACRRSATSTTSSTTSSSATPTRSPPSSPPSTARSGSRPCAPAPSRPSSRSR